MNATRDAIGVLIFAAILCLIGALARADTLPATGSGLSWSITIPAGATVNTVTAQCVDCDFPDEATVSVNGGPTTLLFGVRDPSRDVLVAPNGVPVVLPVTLAPGANTMAFRCERVANCIRVLGITVEYTVPPPLDPLRTWLQSAPALDAWVVSREDIEPSRVMICATDGTRQYATWITGEVERLPLSNLPAADSCSLSWCFASGPTRAQAIREACQ